MGKTARFLTRLLAVSALIGLAMAHSAKADSVTINTTFYYAGPSGEVDNPFSPTVNNSIGNPISGFAITTAGATGTLHVDTTTGVTLATSTNSSFGANLYSVNLAGSNSMVSGGSLVAGTYNFAASGDYFGLATGNGSTGTGSGGGACLTAQSCNNSTNPTDVVTITVGPNGLVTMTSSSLELVGSSAAPPPPSAPEIDPASAMSPLALLAGVVLIMRGRRKVVAL